MAGVGWRETARRRLESESFDLLVVGGGATGVVVNNANGGRITATHIFPAAGSPRTGQLGLRWNF